MIAVIFELEANEGYQEQYLSLAQELKQYLTTIDGFISIERFQSLAEPKKLLSLSFWQSEEAVKQWRNTEAHRLAQLAGRGSILKYYRLRVAHVMRDYGLDERESAPEDSLNYHQQN